MTPNSKFWGVLFLFILFNDALT